MTYSLPEVEAKCRMAISFAQMNGKEVAPDGLYHADCLCLIGSICLEDGNPQTNAFGHEAAEASRVRSDRALGLRREQGRALEAGFCGWSDVFREDAPDLFDLGARLASELNKGDGRC